MAGTTFRAPTGTNRRYERMALSVDSLTTGPLNLGSVTTAATTSVKEYGDRADHLTVMTLTNFAAGTSGDNAAKAIGASLYTFPAGIIMVEWASFINVGVTAAISITTDTPEIGLGSTVASGVNATLGAVAATAEDISEGGDTTNIAPDVAGTATINSTKIPIVATGDDGPKIIQAAGVHVVYLNLAVTWANVDATGAVTVSGTVAIKWRKLT